jgi:DNA (cytosine-5)-methyltransferase 1
MAVYYNEIDPFAAAWLRALMKAGQLPDGEVDTRSIADVQPDDVRGFDQCHFFAGIGGWAYALRLAGWPDDRECWTFSCPCQKFSSASRGRAVATDLWPEQRRLIVAGRPREFLGEQVPHARRWFDGVCADVEALGYAIGAAVLPACGVGFDHARPRLYFVGHTDRDGESELRVDVEVARLSRDRDDAGDMVPADGFSDRVALNGFGNAIVPPLAQVFIEAYLDVAEARHGG